MSETDVRGWAGERDVARIGASFAWAQPDVEELAEELAEPSDDEPDDEPDDEDDGDDGEPDESAEPSEDEC